MELKRKKIRLTVELVLLALLLIVILTLAGFLAYAWYSVGDETGDVNYQAYQIDSVVTMYEANDVNYNGVPDLLSRNGYPDSTYGYYETDDDGNLKTDADGNYIRTHVAYDLAYYNEKYDFNYLDTTLVLTRDSTANMFSPVTIQNLYPSRVYTFKYALANYNFSENTVTFGFDTVTTADGKTVTSDEVLAANFRVRLCRVMDDGTLKAGTWQNFAAGADLANTGILDDDETTDIMIDKYDGDSGSGRLDIWLQIQFLPSADNTLINQTVVFPDISIKMVAEE